MSATDPFAVYFSHSWGERDVGLNILLWEQLSARCRLSIDRPVPTRTEKRPYFVSRLETLLRRADVFVCCLPATPPSSGPVADKPPLVSGDWRYKRCSPYILFELRLAERADLPRFVLFDKDSGFQPPPHPGEHVRYVSRRFEDLRAVIAGGGTDPQLIDALDNWLGWVARNRVPTPEMGFGRTACLLADEGVRGAVTAAFDAADCDDPIPLTDTFNTDAEMVQALRGLDLLVADVSRPELAPLVHAAHALLVPTIRLHTSGPATPDSLPALLRGHPAGYQMDMVTQVSEDVLVEQLTDRAAANRRAAEPVFGFNRGRALLHERTYRGTHSVFISHDLKVGDRALVDLIVKGCEDFGVTAWEYTVENRSGEEWPAKMEAALANATHMIALLSPSYHQSRPCMDEVRYAIDPTRKLILLPFLVNGRGHSLELINHLKIAHEPLVGSHEVNAARVVQRVRQLLLNPPPPK